MHQPPSLGAQHDATTIVIHDNSNGDVFSYFTNNICHRSHMWLPTTKTMGTFHAVRVANEQKQLHFKVREFAQLLEAYKIGLVESNN
jgi:hypothetical protein